MAYRRYTKAQQAQLRKVVEDNGIETGWRIAREWPGMSRLTKLAVIQMAANWGKPLPFDNTAQFVERLDEIIYGTSKLVLEKLEFINPAQLAVVMGIALDKRDRLLKQSKPAEGTSKPSLHITFNFPTPSSVNDGKTVIEVPVGYIDQPNNWIPEETESSPSDLP